jgi:flagellin
MGQERISAPRKAADSPRRQRNKRLGLFHGFKAVWQGQTRKESVMALIINHNMMAMTATMNLSEAFGRLANATNQLSSGLRINSASDDAAGLAIRELMRSDIATLNQGVRNANDAISLLQTADGALGVVDEKLIRMQELAEQAATGTYTSTQRLIIDSEYQAMASEITRIANATDFNGIYLLNGNLSGSTCNDKGIAATGKLKIHFGPTNYSAADYYYIQIGCCTASALGLGLGAAGGSSGQTEAQYTSAHGMGTLTSDPNNGSLPFSQLAGYVNGTMPADFKQQFDPNANSDFYIDRVNNVYNVFATDKSGNLHTFQETYGGQVDYVNGSDKIIKYASKPGASISTQALAQGSLSAISNAIVSKDKIRASIGALENRLQNTVTNLQEQSQNLQSAESQISDVDVATEMTEFVREQILTQSAVAMLSQANNLPKMALQLLSS